MNTSDGLVSRGRGGGGDRFGSGGLPEGLESMKQQP
jgi:hypothetical protein